VRAADRNYQPGNGTRYDLLLIQDGDRLLLVWVGHGAMVVARGEVPAPRYVQERFRCLDGDALAIVGWLRSVGIGAQTAEERVRRGVELLDRVVGEEWVDRVVSETINSSRTDSTVLAQVFGDFDEGCKALGLHAFADPSDHGFDSLCGDWAELDQAWRAVLRSRRAE
jgi:hypothetical protein